MDRFLLHVMIGYPDEDSETRIMGLVREEETSRNQNPEVPQRLSQEIVFQARKEIGQMSVSKTIEDYIVAIIFATRYPGKYGEDLEKWIHVGASPRERSRLARHKKGQCRFWTESLQKNCTFLRWWSVFFLTGAF